MKLEMRRIIIFTADMPAMIRFYRDAMGLKLFADDEDWKEFSAGSCNIALHHGKPTLGKRSPKLSFYAADVAAARRALMRRGAASERSSRQRPSTSATARIRTATPSRFRAESRDRASPGPPRK